jgi:glycosyltransferase involved in cell wall biosynthesis
MKVAVLFHRLGPYHHARLRALTGKCDLTAIEFSTVDNTYGWDSITGGTPYPVISLFTDADVESKPTEAIFEGMRNALERISPDVVAIPGWSSKAALAALSWCCENRKLAVLMSESTQQDERRAVWKEWIKSRIVRLYASALVGGTRHAGYARKLGLSPSGIFMKYDVVDNSYFAARSDDARNGAEMLRKRFALPERYFLASSRFVEKKNLARLIDAYAAYVSQTREQSWDLVLLGDGPMKEAITAQVERLGLASRVRLPGFKQYDELPTYYGLASAFIHASTSEQWGLVVNEAMASRLPVLVSNRCGCAPDLVKEGVNGFTWNPYDIGELASRMAELSSGTIDLRAMGDASREIVEQWGLDQFAENFLNAATAAGSRPSKRAGLVDRAILWTAARR